MTQSGHQLTIRLTPSEILMRAGTMLEPCLLGEQFESAGPNDPYEEQFTVWQLANGPGFGGQVTITKSDMIQF
jgi:hypothetical protein